MALARSAQERAILVGLDLKRAHRPAPSVPGFETVEESLHELGLLAGSAGAVVVDRLVQIRGAPDAATLIGAGKAQELRALAAAQRADLIIFDCNLAPTQLRNLEKAVGCKVVDRTQLILDIFARRARTREGHLQVGLAQLNYLLPRLAGRGVTMSRLGGGIGTRGPGETKLETDRRRIYRRIRRIGQELELVRAARATQRRKRQAVPLATVALVGYTNAGKSTLFNRLTGAGVLADARMFATLDPTVRQMQLPSNRGVLLSDTVGFIRNLPTTLVKAFRATLEEVTEAALLLHVLDVGAPNAAELAAHVVEVLREIGAEGSQQLLVLNKIDLVPGHESESDALARRILGATGAGEGAARRVAAVSARTGEGLPELAGLIDELLPVDVAQTVRYRIPLADAAMVHQLHESARVLRSEYSAEFIEVDAEVPESIRRRLTSYEVNGPSPTGAHV